MNPEPAFLQEIAERPSDDTVRLVYADWLDEQGDPRGRYLRADVDLASLPEDDPSYQALEAELRQLREALDADWVVAAGKRYDVILQGIPDATRTSAVIKEIRYVTGFGLKEVKMIVNSTPMPILLGVARAEAEYARDRLLLQCADVAVRPVAGT
jgi:uncharacterized protein (TIGR02996 family)